LLIAGGQVRALTGVWKLLGAVAMVFAAYAGVVPFLARWVARRFDLGVKEQRTVIFSAGTGNSFVVLPLALALPAGWELTAAVIVLQSLVELGALVGYLWWVPARLVHGPDSTAVARPRLDGGESRHP
jgi:ACR3 family arsenite efflux pump ArsB